MVIWINGAFGAGKTTAAFELHRLLPGSFVYDPENVGYFIRKNAPPVFSEGDFQNIPLWREANYSMLKLIEAEHSGVVIAPMTLVNPAYYAEIVARLVEDGVEVRHFILCAQKETLQKRLRMRKAAIFGRETFALRAIDRCMAAFDGEITGEKISTDGRSVDSIVREIAEKASLTLLPDERGRMRKAWDRLLTLIRHIR